jgi:hypothetical protein
MARIKVDRIEIARTGWLTAFAAAAALAPAPALAGKTDRLAACMWAKMPTTAAAFAETADRDKAFSLFMKAAAPCDGISGNIDLSGLRKTLKATRPAVIGPDLATGNSAFVCPIGPDGKRQPCKPAGE